MCCSMKCRSAAALRKETCIQCGNPFTAKKDGRIYCSQSCAGIAKRLESSTVIFKCEQCGEESNRRKFDLKGEHRFCSKQCAGAFATKKRAYNCDNCGKEYHATPNCIEKFGRRFCSLACSTDSKRLQEIRTCNACGCAFSVQPNRVKSGRGQFCCMRCYRTGTMTLPEKIADRWLESHRIPHEHQKHFRIGYVDFYIPEINTVIEVDGDYWHGTEKQQNKDKSRDAYLSACGIKVVRVKECDLKKRRGFRHATHTNIAYSFYTTQDSGYEGIGQKLSRRRSPQHVL